MVGIPLARVAISGMAGILGCLTRKKLQRRRIEQSPLEQLRKTQHSVVVGAFGMRRRLERQPRCIEQSDVFHMKRGRIVEPQFSKIAIARFDSGELALLGFPFGLGAPEDPGNDGWVVRVGRAVENDDTALLRFTVVPRNRNDVDVSLPDRGHHLDACYLRDSSTARVTSAAMRLRRCSCLIAISR